MSGLWSSSDIGCKWAPFLLHGPSVSTNDALEFIRRTDRALIDPKYACNDRSFERNLSVLIGVPDDWDSAFRYGEAFKRAFGHVELTHLGSNWVASSYIFGPNGPVHPNGSVHKVGNFGKYPSVSEIEEDLSKLAEFSWLSFHLYVWDNHQEEAEGEPDFGWRVDAGKWTRTTDLPSETRREPDLSAALNRIAFMPAGRRECTWTVTQIEEMWGVQIANARDAACTSMREAQP